MKKLVGVIETGFADRIRFCLLLIKWAGITNRIPEFIWKDSKDCCCFFDNLLSSSYIKIHNRDPYSNIKFKNYRYLPEDEVLKLLLEDNNEIIKFQALVDLDYKDFNKFFTINPNIIKTVNDFTLKHNFNDIIGVHIRGTDMIHRAKPIENFYDKIDYIFQNFGQKRIFLATEDTFFDKIFKEKYKDLVFEYPVGSLNRKESKAIIDAFITLLLLQKCKFLIISSYSGFSRFAAEKARSECSLGIDLVIK